jgi:hypothetical protein
MRNTLILIMSQQQDGCKASLATSSDVDSNATEEESNYSSEDGSPVKTVRLPRRRKKKHFLVDLTFKICFSPSLNATLPQITSLVIYFSFLWFGHACILYYYNHFESSWFDYNLFFM